MIAVGLSLLDAAPTASATAHLPNSSAAGMDKTGILSRPAARRSLMRSSAVAAPLRSASRTSAGQ
eukprot:2940493-Pleurochrysis_carterae.AAC.1